jgi:hypothetical protein
LLSIEEVVSQLCAIEQRKKLSPSKKTRGHLLLTEEWMARMKSHDGFGSSADARNSGGNFGSKNKSNKSGVGDAKKSLVGHDDVCGYYGKKGALVP